MQAYSMDLRERALLDSDAGMKAADVAVKYRVSGSWVRLLKQRRRETGESRRASSGTGDAVGAAPAHPGRADRGATGSHLSRAEGRARHAGQSGDDLARGGGSGRDRQKKRSGPPNTIDLTSRPRGSCGTPPRRPGIRHAWFFSMKPALRTISCGMVGPSAGPASTRARPVADQYVSRSAAGDWPTAPGVFDGDRRGELPRLYRTDPRCIPGTSSSPITSAHTKWPASARRSSASAPRSAICRPAVDPPKPSGLSSAPVCRTSAPRNAAITFDTAAIRAPHGHEKRFRLSNSWTRTSRSSRRFTSPSA